MPITTPAPSQPDVDINPKYATRDHAGHVQATYAPGGFWRIFTTPVATEGATTTWQAHAQSVNNQAAAPIQLAVGVDRAAVANAAIAWCTSATTLVLRMDRFVYAGTAQQ